MGQPRVIFFFPDPGGGTTWWSELRFLPDRPAKGDFVILQPSDIASYDCCRVANVYYYAMLQDASIDYEVEIDLPFAKTDEDKLAWLKAHQLEPIEPYVYAELFGVPELAERFPSPPE